MAEFVRGRDDGDDQTDRGGGERAVTAGPVDDRQLSFSLREGLCREEHFRRVIRSRWSLRSEELGVPVLVHGGRIVRVPESGALLSLRYSGRVEVHV